jgi:hypothetical protein
MCVYQKYTWKTQEFYNKIITKHKLPNKSAACNKNIKLWTSLPKIVKLWTSLPKIAKLWIPLPNMLNYEPHFPKLLNIE